MIPTLASTSTPALYQTQGIFSGTASYAEAKAYWANALKKPHFTFEGHISNIEAIRSFFDTLDFTLPNLNFSRCTFSYEAFTFLLGCPKLNCHMELPWVPIEQLFEITPNKLNNILSLTLHPPLNCRAEDTELLTQFIHGLYSQTSERLAISLERWALSSTESRELDIYETRGIQLESFFEFITPVPLMTKGLSILFGASGRYTYIDNPMTIMSRLDLPFAEVDLRNTLLSDRTWLALVDGLNKYPAEALSLDLATLGQIETLLTRLTQPESLHKLDLSRDTNLVTTEEDKERLNVLLTAHLPKFKNLKSLTLSNWYLSDGHLGFIPLLPDSTKLYIENHWIREKPPKAILDQTMSEPDENAMLFSNTQFDKETLETVWEEIFDQDPEFTLNSNHASRLLVDSPDSIRAFFTALKKQNFTRLTLFELQFTKKTWEVFHEQLLSSSSLLSLHLIGCQLKPWMIFSLSELSSLQELTIRSNADLENKREFCCAVKEILQSICLTELNLADNILTDLDVKDIFFLEKDGKPVRVNLHHNAITAEGRLFLDASPFNGQYLLPPNSPDTSRADSPDEEFDQKLESLLKESKFRRRLETQFHIENILPDGNCLFRACCLNTSFSHEELREKVVKHMLANSAKFAPHVEDDMTLEEHAASMSKDKTWGGHVEIFALSEILECPIAVYSKEMNGETLVPNEHCIYPSASADIFSNPKTIFLYRSHENHYSSLKLK